VEIRVADRGIGLEEETKERIFEAFGRGANAEHYQGIGLGLYISQQIVARHGGRIEAEIRGDGPGSVFTVTLPRTGGAA
jgi:two-component system, OmpR family, sensor histidine kinase SenX3